MIAAMIANAARALPVAALPIGVVAIASAALFARTRHCALLGFDSYPLILSARVERASDVFALLGQRLMDGLYPTPFYRPLVGISFAIDHALWGLEPVGYQLTNLLIFAGIGLALHRVALRLTRGSQLAGLAALLIFLLHPAGYELLPIPPRRADMACGLLMLLSIAFELRPRALSAARPTFAPALFTALAIGAKESAVFLPALSFVAVFLYSPRDSAGARLRQAARAMLPHAIAVAGMLGLRVAVLGGLGGHLPIGFWQAIAAAPGFAWQVGAGLALPQPVMRASLLGPSLVALLAASAAAVVGVRWPRARSGRTRALRPAAFPLATTGVFALAWVLLFGITYAISGWIGAWYYLLPALGWSLGLGALAAAGDRLVRSPQPRARVAGASALVAVGAVALWHGLHTPLLGAHDDWARASEASERFQAQLSARIVAAAPGAIVLAPALPMWVQPRGDRATTQGLHILSDYSVQAWSDLVHPEASIRVLGIEGGVMPDGPREAAPGERVVVFSGRHPGF